MRWIVAGSIIILIILFLLFNYGADMRHKDPEYRRKCDEQQEKAIKEMSKKK